MKHVMAVVVLALTGSMALAADAPPPAVGPLLKTTTTSGGEPIALPAGPVEVTAVIAEIAAGGATPEHQHPYLRYGYLLSGRIEISYLDTGETKTLKAGEFFIDPVGKWHMGRALDGKPVRMLIIDQAPPGASNMILREARTPAP